MDEVLQDVERERQEAAEVQRAEQQQLQASQGHQLAAGQQLPRSPMPVLPEAAVRCLNFARFCASASAGGCNSLAPPGLAALEAAAVLLLYLLGVPNALVMRRRPADFSYSFPGSAEDVVALSLARCVVVLVAHLAGVGPRYQR